MASRNEASFMSSIPQPSRNGSPKKDKLSELAASAVNSRNHGMGPPTAKGIPRKTLAERAGEPLSKPGAPLAPRPAPTQVNATSLNGMQRQWSQSTSASSRSYSAQSSRAVSNTSYGSSVGPGSRPSSVSSTRSRIDTGSMRAKRPAAARPPSVLESHEGAMSNGQVLGKRKAFDMEERLQAFEEEFQREARKWNEGMKANAKEHKGLAEMSELYKSRVGELEMAQENLNSKNRLLQAELDSARMRITSVLDDHDRQKRTLNDELEDSTRKHRRELDDLQHESESDRRRLLREHADELGTITKGFEIQMEEDRARHESEIEAVHNAGAHSQKEIETELEQQLSALKSIEDDLERTKSDIVREKDLNDSLREQLAIAARREADLERSVQRLEGHIQFLESDNKSQSHAFADLESRMQRAIQESDEAKEKLIKEETLRRKLHNQVQELKGNIRVFCRVRPALKEDDGTARIDYPDQEIDAKEVEVMGPEEKSSLGNVTTKKHAFSFDKVFGPAAQNQHIFDEISQLVQSALDGYNVCIFCYGQTGSGKTFTMSAADGMIPLAVNQIYSTAKALEEKGWKYTMSGSFIEVYNENLNDLLGKAEDFDKKKHEIRHDMQKNKTEVTGIKTVELDCPGRVEDILRNANRNRTVAATQANERSSRSHSVFILKLNGENSVTGERSEGTLNLVDLAGSERLSHSGATGDRLKETQNINKSLSCLGDVIGALGQGKDGGHIPYRNSKLTYLLQFSLGGNSKTLMFVMISPLQAHLSETLTSLKFATKVHNTHIGTARKQTKTKD